MSCSTNTSRSAGAKVSSTTRSARPIESASSASSSGEVTATGPGAASGGTSRFVARARSMSRQTRATTVVSQPPRLATASVGAAEP